VEVVQTGNLLFLSGMLPVANGRPAYRGRLGAELTVEDGRKVATIACLTCWRQRGTMQALSTR
jgi:hypothetical protein